MDTFSIIYCSSLHKVLLQLVVLDYFILMNGLLESQTELRFLISLQEFLIPLVVISLFLNW